MTAVHNGGSEGGSAAQQSDSCASGSMYGGINIHKQSTKQLRLQLTQRERLYTQQWKVKGNRFF